MKVWVSSHRCTYVETITCVTSSCLRFNRPSRLLAEYDLLWNFDRRFLRTLLFEMRLLHMCCKDSSDARTAISWFSFSRITCSSFCFLSFPFSFPTAVFNLPIALFSLGDPSQTPVVGWKLYRSVQFGLQYFSHATR